MAKKPPKTQIRQTGVRQPKTRLREQPPTKVVRKTVIVKEAPQPRKWLGASPWVVIVVVIVVLLVLFLPIFSVTKTEQRTETEMVPVQKERQEQVTEDETIKVYQGYLEEKGSTVARTGYNFAGLDYWGNPVYVPYIYYETVPGKQTPIDAVQEIVEMQQARGPNDTWVITLTAYDGTQVVYRDIVTPDLTKTGKATVKVTKTVSVPYTELEPQQVTKNVDVKVRVNLIKMIMGDP